MHDNLLVDLNGPDQLQEAYLKRVYELWARKSEEKGGLPSWQDFSLDEIVETMPQMSMVEYVVTEDRFRVHFSGSIYDDLVGRDITGTYFDELPDSDSLIARARRVKDSAVPILMEGLPLNWAGQGDRRYKAFSLPLKTSPNQPVDQLLYMMVLI